MATLGLRPFLPDCRAVEIEGPFMTCLLYPDAVARQEKSHSRLAEGQETSALWLRAARRAAGLTQSELAKRLGVDQSQVARAESGRVELSAANLDRYLRACRFRLVAVPTVAATASEIAVQIRAQLDEGDTSGAFREVIQLIDDLGGVPRDVAPALVATPPTAVNDRYDALIAGVVEWKLNQLKLPIPLWVQESQPLASPWWVYEPLTGDASVEDETPIELRRRRVFIEERDLVSL